EELFLETEPEWRLYEELKARNIEFVLRVQRPRLQREDDLLGRVHFLFDDLSTASWSGAAGFVLRDRHGRERFTGAMAGMIASLPPEVGRRHSQRGSAANLVLPFPEASLDKE